MPIAKCSKSVNDREILSGEEYCANYRCMRHRKVGRITCTLACDVFAYNSKKSGPTDAPLFKVAISRTNSIGIPF